MIGDFWKVGDIEDGNGSHALRLAHGHKWPTWATPPEKSARRLTDVDLDDPSHEYEYGGLGCQCDTCAYTRKDRAKAVLAGLIRESDDEVVGVLRDALTHLEALTPEVPKRKIWVIEEIGHTLRGRNISELVQIIREAPWPKAGGTCQCSEPEAEPSPF